MSVRVTSRPLRLALQHQKRLLNTRSRLHAQELAPGAQTKSSRSLDASKIFQAQSSVENDSAPDSKVPASLGRKRPSSYTVIEACPDPECPCAAMPTMPEGSPIDTKSKMAGLMPYYDRHVITTVPDTWTSSKTSTTSTFLNESPSSEALGSHAAALEWPSKIESDPEELVTILKSHLGPKGDAYRPDFAVSVTAGTVSASDVPSQSSSVSDTSEEVLIFPDFVRVRVQRTSSSAPTYTHAATISSAQASSIDQLALAKMVAGDTPIQQAHVSYSPITQPVVLICGHGMRDARCGILGPLLLAEFRRVLGDGEGDVHLGLVSHIGGHKFAGNVVVYMPPNEDQAERYRGHYEGHSKTSRVGNTPIDGMAVWYGRVEPKHVEGIVNQTIKGGNVIGELLRGVHDFGGAIYG